MEASRKFVCADPVNNENKVWQYEIKGDALHVSWGRVGNSLQSKVFKPFSYAVDVEKKVREKLKKGYEEIKTIEVASATSSVSVKEAAREQLASSDSTLMDLVDLLVEQNAHELRESTGGKMTIDTSTMAVKTEVGAVSLETIDEARTLLRTIENEIVAGHSPNDFARMIGSYLRRVPQRVGHARGWHYHFLSTLDHVAKQSALLDQLESSTKLAIDMAKADVGPTPKLFDCTIKGVSDPDEISAVTSFFEKTLNHNHHAAAKMKVSRVFDIDHVPMNQNFESSLGNTHLLWHGTRVHNVLSILKHGLVLPRTLSTQAYVGAMFGPGLYFSPQSTKSLQYAIGNAPGQRMGYAPKCFMFICEVAVGKSFEPRSPGGHRPAGYDSIWAVGGRSGVINDEVIVPRVSQSRLLRLVEFK